MKSLRLRMIKLRLFRRRFLVISAVIFSPISKAALKSFKVENYTNITASETRSEGANAVQFNLQLNEPGKFLDYYTEADFRYIFDNEGVPSLSVPELYVGYKSFYLNGAKSEINVGRKRLDWNDHQEFWLQNDFNPRQNFTLLNEKTEGIFGFFGSYETKTFEFSGFFSFMNVPELEPQVDIENGEISSGVFWANLPPSRAVFQGVEYPVYYQLNDQSITKLISKRSLGVSTAIKPINGMKLSAHALYKPENVIRPNANGSLDISSSTNRILVEINPVVNHHAIYGGSLEQKWGRYRLNFAYEHIDPLANLGSDFDYVLPTSAQDPRNFQAENYRIAPDYTIKEFFYGKLEYAASYVKTNINFIKKTKGQAPQDDLTSGLENKWQNAIGYGLSYKFSDFNQLNFSLRYDFETGVNVLNGLYSLNIFRNLNLGIGVELIDSDETNTFWSDFVNQDIVYSSLGYTF